jgi:hypothetical protein
MASAGLWAWSRPAGSDCFSGVIVVRVIMQILRD